MEKDSVGKTDSSWPGQILHQAVLYNNIELMLCLLEGQEKEHLNSQDKMGRTCVYTAVSNNSDECLQMLLNIGADVNIAAGKRYNSMTPLHSAICDNKINIVKILLSHNADIYVSDDSGSTPTSLAKVLCNRELVEILDMEIDKRKMRLSKTAESLHQFIMSQNLQQVKDILSLSGISCKRLLKFVPENATPVLCSAAQVGNIEIISTLIAAGALPVVDPMTALSPLHYACDKGHNSVLLLLLNHFPEFANSLSACHELPIHFAATNGKLDVFQSLLGHFYPANVLDTYEVGQIKYKAPFDVNSMNANGFTSLHIACIKGHISIVKELLQYSVSIETDSDSATAANPNLNSFQSFSSEFESMNDYSTLQPKVQPVNINYLTADGYSALHLAIKHKHYEVADILLSAWADVTITIKLDRQPRSLILYCLEVSDSRMLGILLSHGVEDLENKGLFYAIHCNKAEMVIILLQHKSAKCHHHSLKRSELRRAYSQMYYSTDNLEMSEDSKDKQTTSPVAINLHGLRVLSYLPEACITGASILHNPFLNNCDKQLILYTITKVDISENVFDCVPLILFELPSLCVLNMSHNEIAEFPSDDEFSENVKCFNLEEINLQRNCLVTVPVYLFKLPQLKILNLSLNRLVELPIEMWSASSLVHLNCTNNKLKSLPYTTWDDVFSKQSSHTSGSSLSSGVRIDPRSYSGTSADEWMAFERRSEANISDSMAPQDVMENDVVHINHWSSKITVLDNDSTLHNSDNGLQKLELAKNLFQEIPYCLACCSPNLKYLDISMNPLLSVGSLSDLPVNLQELNISWTGLADLKPWTSPVTNDDQPCYGGDLKSSGSTSLRLTPTYHKSSPTVSSRDSYGGHSVLQSAYCPHRLHTQLVNLEKLNLSFNKLKMVDLARPNIRDHPSSDNSSLSSLGLESDEIQSRLLFPHVNELDLSSNQLTSLSVEIGDMIDIKVLLLNKNVNLKELPPKLGLLKHLWKLELELCPLDGTIQDLMKNSRYPVKDILGFLRSILEESTEYNSMNLMFVGSHKMGKTSLLERMRREGKSSNSATHWRDRVSDKPTNLGGRKGETLSTVGIDINDLNIDRRSKGPVHFRTWDFGGQREYYATHQYFLSPRSLYLVIWNIIEGEKGVESLLQWLINIQARAPGTSVIIVGTHLDILKDKVTKRNYPPDFEEAMNGYIFKTFINEQEPEKSGLPLIRDVINISSKTGENIKRLVDSIYEHAFDLHHPKVKSQKLLKQKIPKKYLLLQDIVREIARERILEQKDPVLIKSKYMLCVSNKLIEKEEKTFRDVEELGQATRFLHENGVLFHYEDLPLRDLYFLDPQWLCDQLAKVITVREVNTFAPRGIMEIDNLKFLFKSSAFKHDNIQTYITNLLGKFEVALQFDKKNLILPSLLPKEDEMRYNILQKVDIRIPLRRDDDSSVCIPYNDKQHNIHIHQPVYTAYRPLPPETQIVGRSQFYANSDVVNLTDSIEDTSLILLKMKPSCNPVFSYTRLYFMTYIPSGFWPRLITRVLADSSLYDIIVDLFQIPPELKRRSAEVQSLSESSPDWRCWQTGLELLHYGFEMLRIREVTVNSVPGVCDYTECRIKCAVDSEWSFLDIYRSKILEITFPTDSLTFHLSNQEGIQIQLEAFSQMTTVLRDDSVVAKLLVKIVEHVDNLLQDWYPELGELRFSQTCEGRYLVTRVVLCPQCLHEEVKRQKSSDQTEAWYFLDADCPEIRAKRIGPETLVKKERKKSIDYLQSEMEFSVTESLKDGQSLCYNKVSEEGTIYSFFIERCMLDSLEGLDECCPLHGSISPALMMDTNGVGRLFYLAPDVAFHDLSSDVMITQTDIMVRGNYLGKGTFGDVYAGTLSRKGEGQSLPVAMKILFTSSKHHNLHQGVQGRLDRASQAYLIARQEISILQALKHNHIVPLLGLQIHPLCLVLSLAPLGALDYHLRDLHSNSQLLPLFVIRNVIIQIGQAVAYLHSNNIIYRDLKSENVLVWALPTASDSKPCANVHVKIADYGISRAVLPSGAKGFGGTPPFIAPEILQHAGKDTYTEKVDIFSFGMFMYELITCRLPLIEINNPNSYICQGGRPSITSQDINNYPTSMLDLMSTAWSHDPCDRPTAQDIVSIATSTQFLHLRDIVSIGPDIGIQCGVVVPSVEQPLSFLYTNEDDIDDDDDKNIDNYIWLSTNHRTGCSIEVLGFNQWNHCVSSKTVSVSGTDVTAMCVVEDIVWCADTKGFITFICCKSHKLIRQFTLPLNQLTDVFVVGINYFPHVEKVVVVLQSGELYILNTIQGHLKNTAIQDYKIDVCLCSATISHNKGNELWLGQAAGKIGVWDITKHCMIGQLESCDKALPVGTFCMFMVSSRLPNSDQIHVWSYNYPGYTILRWNTANRIIMNKLDLSQITNINSVSADLSKCQVTALNVGDKYLYIGTTLGSVLVTDNLTLSVYNIISCHTPTDFFVKCLLPFPCKTIEDAEDTTHSPGLISVGKGYVDLIKISPDSNDVKRLNLSIKDGVKKDQPTPRDPLLHHTFVISLEDNNWQYY